MTSAVLQDSIEEVEDGDWKKDYAEFCADLDRKTFSASAVESGSPRRRFRPRGHVCHMQCNHLHPSSTRRLVAGGSMLKEDDPAWDRFVQRQERAATVAARDKTVIQLITADPVQGDGTEDDSTRRGSFAARARQARRSQMARKLQSKERHRKPLFNADYLSDVAERFYVRFAEEGGLPTGVAFAAI